MMPRIFELYHGNGCSRYVRAGDHKEARKLIGRFRCFADVPRHSVNVRRHKRFDRYTDADIHRANEVRSELESTVESR